jgi:DNA invertase Pin-like site-specific DNA recombinase
MEVKKVLDQLFKVQHNKSKLAIELYINRTTLYNWYNKKTEPRSKATILRLKMVAKKYNIDIK